MATFVLRWTADGFFFTLFEFQGLSTCRLLPTLLAGQCSGHTESTCPVQQPEPGPTVQPQLTNGTAETEPTLVLPKLPVEFVFPRFLIATKMDGKCYYITLVIIIQNHRAGQGRENKTKPDEEESPGPIPGG